MNPCAPDLASRHTGGNSVAFSQSEESMWPVNQMMLSRKLPNSVTTSHELHDKPSVKNATARLHVEYHVACAKKKYLSVVPARKSLQWV